MPWCNFCSAPAEGNHSIHRDGYGDGPEIELCDDCGGSSGAPELAHMWHAFSNGYQVHFPSNGHIEVHCTACRRVCYLQNQTTMTLWHCQMCGKRFRVDHIQEFNEVVERRKDPPVRLERKDARWRF